MPQLWAPHARAVYYLSNRTVFSGASLPSLTHPDMPAVVLL